MVGVKCPKTLQSVTIAKITFTRMERVRFVWPSVLKDTNYRRQWRQKNAYLVNLDIIKVILGLQNAHYVQKDISAKRRPQYHALRVWKECIQMSPEHKIVSNVQKGHLLRKVGAQFVAYVQLEPLVIQKDKKIVRNVLLVITHQVKDNFLVNRVQLEHLPGWKAHQNAIYVNLGKSWDDWFMNDSP